MTLILDLIHFAVLNISYSLYNTGILITIITNNPCHLTCYYTDKEPLKHATARTIRGITLPWGNYFCFVAWHTVEQIEPGDTLIHTFDLTPWPICQTRWFTFRGEVDNIPSPSAGPIFKYHIAHYPQLHYNQPTQLGAPNIPRRGQRLKPAPLTIKALAFVLSKEGHPTGNITFTIRRVSDDTIITSKYFGRAENLTATPTWSWVTFDPPPLINQEIRFLAEVDSPFYENFVKLWVWMGNIKPQENHTAFVWTTYIEENTEETAYNLIYQ